MTRFGTSCQADAVFVPAVADSTEDWYLSAMKAVLY